MKNLKSYLLLAFVLGFSLSSCNDKVEVFDENQQSTEMFDSEMTSQIQSAFNLDELIEVNVINEKGKDLLFVSGLQDGQFVSFTKTIIEESDQKRPPCRCFYPPTWIDFGQPAIIGGLSFCLPCNLGLDDEVEIDGSEG